MKKIYLIATIAAIIAGFATYFFANQLKKSTQIENVETSDVVIALGEIPINTLITEEMVMIKNLPAVSVTPGVATNLAEVVGKISHSAFAAGEQMLLTRLTTVGSETSSGTLSFQLAEDEYAFTLSVNSAQSVSNFVSVGDYVDLIYMESGKEKPTAEIIYENIKILRVSNNSTNVAAETGGTAITSYAEVVISVTKEQALRLSEYVQTGSIRFLLKSILLGKEFEKTIDDTPSEATTAPNDGEVTTKAPEATTVPPAGETTVPYLPDMPTVAVETTVAPAA